MKIEEGSWKWWFWVERDDIKQNQKQGGIKMEKKVLDAMKKAGKPVKPADVAKLLGAESKEVSKVFDQLKKKGKIHSPKRCYYEPT